MTQRKSESARLNLRLTHRKAAALAASLTTEASFQLADNSTLFVDEVADSIVDLRARWNTLMRGLIASEHVLGLGGEVNE